MHSDGHAVEETRGMVDPSVTLLCELARDTNRTEIELEALGRLREVGHNDQGTAQIEIKFGTVWLLFEVEIGPERVTEAGVRLDTEGLHLAWIL